MTHRHDRPITFDDLPTHDLGSATRQTGEPVELTPFVVIFSVVLLVVVFIITRIVIRAFGG